MPGRVDVAQASPALRERAGQSPRESRFILDPLMDRTLDELDVDRLVVANPQQTALTAVLKRFKRGELTAPNIRLQPTPARW